jgi:hypothetical protein
MSSLSRRLKVTLDKGPRSRDQCIQAILLVQSLNWSQGFKGPRPKKWPIEVKPTWHRFWKENQLVLTKKNSAKRRAPDLENQESG